MPPPRILALAGSLRRDSFNKKLARVAAEAARSAGADVTWLDLRDCPMPIFDQDLEAETGMPEGASRFKQALRAHDGLLVASPEYNSSITPVLKNAIDWASRAEGQEEPPLAAFRGKVVALLSASPGALGGLRGLVTVRSIFGNIGCHVLPDQVAVPKAHAAFAEDGSLGDERSRASVERLAVELVRVTMRLHA
jgi:NAD(P)H-dependent FMN reductase